MIVWRHVTRAEFNQRLFIQGHVSPVQVSANWTNLYCFMKNLQNLIYALDKLLGCLRGQLSFNYFVSTAFSSLLCSLENIFPDCNKIA